MSLGTNQLMRLLPASNSRGTGALTFSDLAIAAETVTIDGTVYTFRAAVSTTADEVLIGADANACAVNLAHAINATPAQSGTLFGSATVAHTKFTASASAGVVTILAKGDDQYLGRGGYEGPTSHALATTETLTNGAWAAAVTGSGATTATNSAPSSATAGAEIPFTCDRALLFLFSVAGSGSMDVTCKLWGYHATLARWFPLGVHATAASKGLINAANAMGETGSDSIRHCEEITSLRGFARLYLEVTAINGTATAVAAYVRCVPAETVSRG
jgi:hypothetical protein